MQGKMWVDAGNSRTWGTRPCAFLSAGLSPATRVGEELSLFCKWCRKVFSNFNVHTSPRGILIPLVLVGPQDAAFRASSQVVLMLLVINHTLNSEDGKMSGNENDISCIPQATEKLIPLLVENTCWQSHAQASGQFPLGTKAVVKSPALTPVFSKAYPWLYTYKKKIIPSVNSVFLCFIFKTTNTNKETMGETC